MTVQSDALFCFGFGYSAKRLAERVLAEGWPVSGTTRSEENAQKISDLHENCHGVVFNRDTEIRLKTGQHWLISIPPDDTGCAAFAASQSAATAARSITYLSTTGVYGDHQGGWVYEDTAATPQSDRAKRRVLAEQQWASVGANIVRLPGIYGPGRSALDRVRAGTAKRIIKEGQVFSRVHVDDIASGLHAILTGGFAGKVFHLCDDEPAPPQDVIAYAAELLAVAPPPAVDFETADLSAMARSFYSECKRVSNAATKGMLGWQPRYPSYREGLASILAIEARS